MYHDSLNRQVTRVIALDWLWGDFPCDHFVPVFPRIPVHSDQIGLSEKLFGEPLVGAADRGFAPDERGR